MTPTEQATRWLADVRRYDRNGRHMELDPQGPWLHEAEVLAAIASHLAPGDDAVLIDALLTEPGFDKDWREAAAARISALTATVEELRYADRVHASANAGMKQRLETDNATLRDRLALVEGALIWCSAASDFAEGGVAREGWLKLCAPLIAPDVADAELLQVIVADQFAAITDGGTNG